MDNDFVGANARIADRHRKGCSVSASLGTEEAESRNGHFVLIRLGRFEF